MNQQISKKSTTTYTLFIATFNVNEKIIQDEAELCRFATHFLACDYYNNNNPISSPPPDIYAIGFQELAAHAEAFLHHDDDDDDDEKFDSDLDQKYEKEIYWTNLCHRSLHLSKEYQLLESVRFVGKFLFLSFKSD